MSAALNARGDTSIQSAGTHPDLSLGSFVSGFSTPARRAPSASTATSSAPLSTPSPPTAAAAFRKRLEEGTPLAKRFSSQALDDADDGIDVLDTPGREKRLDEHLGSSPGRAMTRTKSTGPGTKGSVNLTLRDQEKHIDSLKKENWNIKLKVHFLEERLAQLAPDQIDSALKQNINLKIEVQQRGMEIKRLRKLVLDLERELERLQRGSGGAESRARELEQKLEEREREIREMRRRRAVGPDDAALRELESRNQELEEELEGVKGLLEENMEEMERLRKIAERGGGGDEQLRQNVEELEQENEELRTKLDEQEELLAHRNDEKEDMADEIEALRLEIEDIQRRREAESLERSQSRAQILEAREEREAVEDDLNAFRDKLAAVHIELQQKDDEIEMKNREIEDLIAEHERIVDTVQNEWRGEVEEARNQVEELRDVLEQRDAESKELREHVSDLEAGTTEMHEKFEAALAHLERESEEKDAEIVAANREIEKLGEQVYLLEEENDRIKEESDRIREDDAVERERLSALTAALKDVGDSLPPNDVVLTPQYRKWHPSRHNWRKPKTSMNLGSKKQTINGLTLRNSRVTSRTSLRNSNVNAPHVKPAMTSSHSSRRNTTRSSAGKGVAWRQRSLPCSPL
ncbi:microtubule associated-domain-containing protein [Cristinia sonorae]|uniref:Microtubule associated-domain-containing protein n=1 Tax=Cristinia sonorae TaxID=1940300 RepID=A0A8K0UP48_9AGAR|nr:microtubule associated-domain-containing protein [Cristinia sonorae]